MLLTKIAAAVGVLAVVSIPATARPSVQWWLTTSDRTALFTRQSTNLALNKSTATAKVAASNQARYPIIGEGSPSDQGRLSAAESTQTRNPIIGHGSTNAKRRISAAETNQAQNNN